MAASAETLVCCPPLAGPHLSHEDAGAVAGLFKSLADPARVRIINMLAQRKGPLCVCDITAAVGLSQPTVSFHLKKLVSSRLLERTERGTWAYYSLNRKVFESLSQVFETKGGN